MAKKQAKQPKPITSLDDLTPDRENANLGTDRGRGVIDWSLEQHGFGRSILVDRDGNVIAGNKTLEEARKRGLPVIVVQSPGDAVLVHQRTEIDLYDEQDTRGREMAYADNRAAELGLMWSPEQIARDQERGVSFAAMWSPDELAGTKHKPMPSLDDLEKEYGDGEDSDFWPVIRVQVPPEVMRKWEAAMEYVGGETDVDRVSNLLDRFAAAIAQAVK